MHYTKFRIIVVTSLIASGCVPLHLQKYRQQRDHSLAPSQATGISEPTPGVPGAAEPGVDAQSTPNSTATIYVLDRDTYRLHLAERDVWEAVLSVLMRNYSPLIADKNQGIFATEWDSYFLNGVVYRNKISLRLTRGGPGITDMTIHNSVEQLQDGAVPLNGANSGTWLPAGDPADEIGRIIKNMAIVLGQPVPRLQQAR